MDLYSSLYKLDAGYRGKIFDKMINGNDGISIIPIHSIFHKVINISFNELILSIVNRNIGMSDAYVQVSDNVDFEKLDLNVNMKCIIDKNKLVIGESLLINLNYSKPWEDVLNRDYKFSIYNVPYQNITSIKYTLDRCSATNSGWRILCMDKELRNRVLSTLYNPYDTVKSIIGYGIGLTPTCDDIILGIMSVMNYCIEYKEYNNKFKRAVMDNINYTTDISAGILRIAQMGYYHEYIQEVIYSVVEGNREMVNLSAKKLLTIGATSGSDILTGIYIGFMNLML